MARKQRDRHQKKILIIAGPNGAGKTTFATEFLLNEGGCPDFINADLIARGLSPFAPEKTALQAGKIMLRQITTKVEAGESFAFETTLSGMTYAQHIPRWRQLGYHVRLVFLKLPTVEMAIARVQSRVAQGGHAIPHPVIRRRFDAGLRNFEGRYRAIVNDWALYDSAGSRPKMLAEGKNR